MFNLNRDFDSLEAAIRTYFYYLWEIEKGNIDYEDKRIIQHKKIAKILCAEPESCSTVLHNIKTDSNPNGHDPLRATQLLSELKINKLLIDVEDV